MGHSHERSLPNAVSGPFAEALLDKVFLLLQELLLLSGLHAAPARDFVGHGSITAILREPFPLGTSISTMQMCCFAPLLSYVSGASAAHLAVNKPKVIEWCADVLAADFLIPVFLPPLKVNKHQR